MSDITRAILHEVPSSSSSSSSSPSSSSSLPLPLPSSSLPSSSLLSSSLPPSSSLPSSSLLLLTLLGVLHKKLNVLINDIVRGGNTNSHQNRHHHHHAFSSTDYFFVSTNLARRCIEVPESAIVLAYSDQHPTIRSLDAITTTVDRDGNISRTGRNSST